MVGHFNDASQKCPDAVIIAGGYSQGAALAAASVTDVDDSIRQKIAGTVLFGYTKNLQVSNSTALQRYGPWQDR